MGLGATAERAMAAIHPEMRAQQGLYEENGSNWQLAECPDQRYIDAIVSALAQADCAQF
jgi:hypothetical protein